jgi:hypothetical protein
MAQPAPIIPLTAKELRLARLTNGREPIVVVATTTTASANVTAAGALTGVAIGAKVTGLDIPPGTTVIDLDDVAHTAVLSGPATTGHAATPLTFTNPAFPGPLKLRLFKDVFDVNDATVLADLTPHECDFDSYTPGGYMLTFTPGYITIDNIPSNESQMIAIIMATAAVTNTVTGWWIDDGTQVWMVAKFDGAGISMARVGAALKLMVEDSYPPGLPISVILPAA